MDEPKAAELSIFHRIYFIITTLTSEPVLGDESGQVQSVTGADRSNGGLPGRTQDHVLRGLTKYQERIWIGNVSPILGPSVLFNDLER